MLNKNRSPSIIPEISENQKADEITNTSVDRKRSTIVNPEPEKPKVNNTINDTLTRFMLLDRLAKRKQYEKSELDQIQNLYSTNTVDQDAKLIEFDELYSNPLTPKQKLYRQKMFKLASPMNK